MADTRTRPLIADAAALRQEYAAPIPRALAKSLAHLDRHMREFIALSPFVVIASAGPGGADAAPRGDAPGFVHVLDDATLLLPDWPGNNRLDTLANVVEQANVGLLFLIPGVDETLRVNGIAEITMEPSLLTRWDVNGKHPKSVLRVAVREAFLHCGKALIRSRLWHGDYVVDRNRLPSYGQMLKDQIATAETADELQASVVEGYKTRLY